MTGRISRISRWSAVRRTGVVLSLALVLSLHSAGQIGKPTPQTPTATFQQPTGAFAVGTRDYLWVDQNRAEPFTADPADRRHLLVRVWYPSERMPGNEGAAYISNVNEFPEKSVYRRGEGIKTNSITDAPFARVKSRFPVLVYPTPLQFPELISGVQRLT